MTPADPLLAAVLADPADPLRRLVLADFLDESGGPSAVAWAGYIRRRAAAAAEPNPIRRELLRDEATELVPKIVAGLTLPAADFLTDAPNLLELLPAERFTLKLAGFMPPRTPAVSANACRALVGLPLGTCLGRTVVGRGEVAGTNWSSWETLVGDCLYVRIRIDELEPALQRLHAPRALALRMPLPTADPLPPTLDEQLTAATAEVMRTFLEQLVSQARERGATEITITAYTDHHWVRRTEKGKSVRWHRVAASVGRRLVQTARVLPARRLHVRVRRRDTSFGEGVRIVLLNPPATSGVSATMTP